MAAGRVESTRGRAGGGGISQPRWDLGGASDFAAYTNTRSLPLSSSGPNPHREQRLPQRPSVPRRCWAARSPPVVVLWGLDNKAPLRPPRRTASLLGHVKLVYAFVNSHAFSHGALIFQKKIGLFR